MLYYFFWLEAAIFTGALYLFSPALHPGWILPILLGAFVVLCLLFLLYLYLTPVFFPKGTPKHPSRYAASTIRIALSWFMRIFFVKIRVEGAEKLPNTPVVLVCNHRSALDPVFIICGFKKRRMAFVAKQSVMKYPVVGPHARRAGFLGIDRESPMQSLRTIKRAAEFVKNDGIDYGIFPEGTRSRDGKLLPFKTGAFMLAKRANAPLAVLTMQGSERVIKGLPFRRPKIFLRVETVIAKEEVARLSAEELSDMTRGAMARDLPDFTP